MSWIIVGNEDYANFACDTSMTAFGPLHSNYGDGDAVEELKEFADTLSQDPRRLHDAGTLEPWYVAWKRED